MLAVVLAGGCLRDTEFHCTSDSQCGSDGQCDGPTTFCTVPDSNCVLGRRYSEYSGSYTNRCVMANPVDAGLGCAPGFVGILGAGSHLYHQFTTPADFTSQRTACAAQGGITYLAIPDDQNELQALVSATAQPAFWVGIDDMVVQGNYMTVRGQPATFLPWAPGQPDNAGSGEDCVAALGSATLDDQACANKLPAVCECEP